MLKFNPTTPVRFYVKETVYVPGEGQATVWTLITSGDYSTFYCEWKGGYGDRALSAESLGVKDFATVRTFYNPTLYEKLRTMQVIVIKNMDCSGVETFYAGEVARIRPDRNNPNVYELWGGVDNVREENRFIEFRVRRYEGL